VVCLFFDGFGEAFFKMVFFFSDLFFIGFLLEGF